MGRLPVRQLRRIAACSGVVAALAAASGCGLIAGVEDHQLGTAGGAIPGPDASDGAGGSAGSGGSAGTGGTGGEVDAALESGGSGAAPADAAPGDEPGPDADSDALDDAAEAAVPEAGDDAQQDSPDEAQDDASIDSSVDAAEDAPADISGEKPEDSASGDSPVGDAPDDADGGLTCQPGTGYCVGNLLKSCDTNGSTTTDTLCQGGTPICDAASNSCLVCAPAAAVCQGSSLRTCAADGLSFTSTTDCGNDLLCDAPAAMCLAPGGVKHYSLGSYHACAVVTDGSVHCWGGNSFGQLGNGTTDAAWAPVAVSGLPELASEVEVGYSHSCALLVDKTVACWGSNSSGQLGPAAGAGAGIPPTRVTSLSNVTSIAAGYDFTCALVDSGAARCWGRGADGSLGNGLQGDSSTPQVVGLSGQATDIAAHALSSIACARLVSGAVECWGEGVVSPAAVPGVASADEVKVGSPQADDSTGQRVLIRTGGIVSHAKRSGAGWSTPTNLATGFAKLAGGGSICGITNSGLVSCGAFSNLGPGAPATVPGVPANSAIDVRSGQRFECLRTTQSNLMCWGQAQSGVIGNGASTYAASPVVVDNVAGVARITASGSATAAVRFDQGVTAWGSAPALGLDNSTPKPIASLGFDNVNVWLSSFGDQGYALKTSGMIAFLALGWPAATALAEPGHADWVFARPSSHVDFGLRAGGPIVMYARSQFANEHGIFGDGSTQSSAGVTAEVPGLTDIQGIAARPWADHVCAWMTDATMKCWGSSSVGQVGNGLTLTNVTTPASVDFPSPAPPIQHACVGYQHTCALTQAGKVLCWGDNYNGQIGVAGSQFASPIEVAGLPTAQGLTCGANYTCIWTAGGEVWCWGQNSSGELGLGIPTDKSSPDKALVSNVISLSAGDTHTCALHGDHTVSCWGYGANGQLGNGFADTYTTPQAVQGL